jgi:hypothetical protein
MHGFMADEIEEQYIAASIVSWRAGARLFRHWRRTATVGFLKFYRTAPADLPASGGVRSGKGIFLEKSFTGPLKLVSF